ncbi:hypothetical protein RF11_03455 [Thelohanellus kitauei]|uniref:Transposon Ty3-I Gag-Pol polyprotein n=1 Tax=Thelohanellus kitauei TaxID=669202 RepID=A0A0C2I633_THEKT|nr:hypothetical protein RF11_03455 [Thelohanellus kitauei]
MHEMIVDISSEHKLYPRLPSKQNDIVGAITDDILSCSDIPSQYQPNLIEILGTYNYLFADPKFPIAVRHYRGPGNIKNKIRDQINSMLTDGVIPPSSSPWSAPCIFVKKRMARIGLAPDHCFLYEDKPVVKSKICSTILCRSFNRTSCIKSLQPKLVCGYFKGILCKPIHADAEI